MKSYKYLIIGGGMTAASAVTGIREVDSTGSIGLISSEVDAARELIAAPGPFTRINLKGRLK